MGLAQFVATDGVFPPVSRPDHIGEARVIAARRTHDSSCSLMASSRDQAQGCALGHSTVALTLDIYSPVLPQADQDAADRIAALIEH